MFHIAQSTQKLALLAQGQGLEPRLEFSPSVLELGPLLPYASGDEAEVIVRNPCNFPIEFYSLEFDQQYLLEEKVSRDQNQTPPPAVPGPAPAVPGPAPASAVPSLWPFPSAFLVSLPLPSLQGSPTCFFPRKNLPAFL